MHRSLLVAAVVLIAAAPAAADYVPRPVPGETRQVILVGNNWDGTTDVVDPYTLRRLDRVNVVPDRAEREAEIMLNPDKQAYFLLIRQEVGEGNDQFNDDVFSSHDGRTIYVSRPSFADVVAIDLKTHKIVWRTEVGGYRADHMAISADGTRLLVSASTANIVDEIDTATGKILRTFPSGDSPHENNYSKDGSLIYHASIGRVYLPADSPEQDRTAKGKRVFEIVDNKTFEVVKELDMGAKLEEAGFKDMSSAVRPMALSPDEKFLYFQVSFFHGFVEYDLTADKVTRVAELPESEESAKLSREDYLLDSAHHGLAMNPQGTQLCVAGTMDGYGAIVNRKTFKYTRLDGITKPYWSTNSADGRYCYISGSGDDALFVISYRSQRILAKFGVGDHPQRVRNGVAALAVYPEKGRGEPFRFAAGGSAARPTCRARGARELLLASCLVELRAPGGRLLGRGERIVRGKTAFPVPVKLAKGASGRATLVARGTDSLGRVRTVRRPVTLHP